MDGHPHVAVRVDGGADLGVGHAMRCATLAHALVDRGARVTVVTRSMPDWVADRHRRAGATVVDLESGVRPDAVVDDADVWIVDGYTLGPEMTGLVERGAAVAAIDDNHELPVSQARLVVNQNLHAVADLYPDVGEATGLLLGSVYALIRSDVTAIDRTVPPDRAVLVAFGGTDPARLTRPVVSRLLETTDARICVALGADHPDRPALEEIVVREAARVWFDPGDLTAGLRVADVAVIGGGSTLWEVAHLGIPSIAVVVADNQVAGTAAAAEAGFVIGLDARVGGDRPARVAAAAAGLLDDGTRRAELAAAGRRRVDGRGAQRVASAVLDLASDLG